MEKATMDLIRNVIGDATESEKAALTTRQTDGSGRNVHPHCRILVGVASFLTRFASNSISPKGIALPW